jgi:KAP-like P-loop domain-containing protein
MASGTLKKEITLAGVSRTFFAQNWQLVVSGLLLGIALGFAFPSLVQIISGFVPRMLRFANRRLGKIAVWPSKGWQTICLLVLVAGVFYIIRLFKFLKKLWSSWLAGLLSGTAALWFLTSSAAFCLLNFGCPVLSLFVLLLGGAATLTIIYRDFRLIKAASEQVQTAADEPISRREQDTLGRQAVVDSIVRAVLSDRSPVVALTGTYGDGKTSVLNLLRNELENRNDVVAVPFTPWLPMNDETLISTLFGSILEKLQTRLFIPDIKRDLLKFTRILFAVVPQIPTSFKNLLEKPSQGKQISEIQKSLARLPFRVAVLLDDMDRMHRSELETLLKLIRGVPQFPQLTYVCAFDQEALARILHGDDSSKNLETSHHYLEKFFPEKIPLPKIEEALLATEFEKRFLQICDQNNLLAHQPERSKFLEDWRAIWQTSVRRYVANLRRLNLFVNRLSEALPAIGHEVNLQDLLLLELVRMLDPVMYEEIFRNAPYFMFAGWRWTTLLQAVHIDADEEKRRGKIYFDALFKDLPRPPDGVLLGLLSAIFPSVDSYLKERGTPARASRNQEEAERQRRAFHPDFFPRYFIFRVPNDLFGEIELSSFVSSLNEAGDSSRQTEVFKRKYEELEDLPMKRWDFLYRVRASMERFSLAALQAMLAAVSDLSGQFTGDPNREFDRITAIGIVFSASNRLKQNLGAEQALAYVIRNASSDRFATEVLNEVTNAASRRLDVPVQVNRGSLE